MMKRSIAMLPTLLIISAILANSSTAISNNKINTSNKQTGNNNNILLSRHHPQKDNKRHLLNRSNRLFQSGKLFRTSELDAEVDVQVDKVSPQYTNPILDGRTHKERNKGSDDSSSSKESEDTLLNVNVNVNVHNNGQDDSRVNERYGEGGSSVDDGQDWFDYDRQDSSSSSSSDSSESSGDSSESSEDTSSSESSSSESTSQDMSAGDTSWIGSHNTATHSTSSSSSSDDIDECIKSGGTWSLNSWNRKLLSNPNNHHNQQHQGQQHQQEQGQRMAKTQKAGKNSKTKWADSTSTDYFEWNNGWWYESNGWWYPANWGWNSGKSGKSGYNYSKSSKSKSSKGWKCVHPPSTPTTDKPTSVGVPTQPSDKPTFAEIIETDKPTIVEEETDKPTEAPITPIPTEIVVTPAPTPLPTPEATTLPPVTPITSEPTLGMTQPPVDTTPPPVSADTLSPTLPPLVPVDTTSPTLSVDTPPPNDTNAPTSIVTSPAPTPEDPYLGLGEPSLAPSSMGMSMPETETESPTSSSSSLVDTSDVPSTMPSNSPTIATGEVQDPTGSPTYIPSYVPTATSEDDESSAPSTLPSTQSSELPSSVPTATSNIVESTTAPTISNAPTPAVQPPTNDLAPAGSIYYQSFEDPVPITFPFGEVLPVTAAWNSVNNNENNPDSIWEQSDERANTGLYSMKSPILETVDKVSASSNLTLVLGDNGVGALHFSVLAGNQMPYDWFQYAVDGVVRGVISDPSSEFQERVIQVGPGAHTFDFVYSFNPQNIPVQGFPPDGNAPNRSGTVFIDNVYFIPAGANIEPTEPDEPECEALEPNPYGFETENFPTPPWSTSGEEGTWSTTTDKFFEGAISLRSPPLEDIATTTSISNATLQICDDFLGGVLRLQAYASVQPPRDIFIVFVDGEVAAQLVDVNEWTELALGLEPGPHTIDFSYQYNPFDVAVLPPSPPTRDGAVWIDEVQIETLGTVPSRR